MEKITYPKYRWFVLIVMFLSIFASAGLILISPAALVGIISASTGWKLGTVTVITMGSFTFFIAVGCLLSAFLLDKIGIFKTYIISGVIAAAGAFLVPVLGTSVLGLIFCRLLEGIGGGLVLGSPARIASEWFPSEERGIVTGFSGAGVGLGTSVGLIISPAIYSATGSWITTMALVGFGPVVALILSFFLRFGSAAPPVEAPVVEPTASAGSKFNANFKLALKEPLFYLGIIMIFCFSWVQQGYGDLTPGYLAVDAPTGLGWGAQIAGNTFSVYSLAFMVGSILSGFIMRFIFKNRLKLGLALAFVLSAFFNVSIMFPIIHESRGAVLFCLTMAGFFYGWCSPMIFAFIAQTYPVDITGRVGGITQGIGTLGATVGVGVGSIALNMTGKYIVSITILCIMCLLNFVFTFFLYKPKVFADKVH